MEPDDKVAQSREAEITAVVLRSIWDAAAAYGLGYASICIVTENIVTGLALSQERFGGPTMERTVQAVMMRLPEKCSEVRAAIQAKMN